jgi:Rad3-related DNA helicase
LKYGPYFTGMTEAEIKAKFPFAEFRPDQLTAIRSALDQFAAGKRFVLLEAPTGMGKSAIAYTIAQFFDSSFWLSSQKVLQDQIMRDFGDRGLIVDLKGRGNYSCTYGDRYAGKLISHLLTARGHLESDARRAADYFVAHKSFVGLDVDLDLSKLSDLTGRKLMCDRGICRTRDGKAKCDECVVASDPEAGPHCAYWARHALAKQAPICLMNFSVFLHQTALTHAFAPRSLLLIDEGHTLEQELLSFISFSLSDRTLREYGIVLENLPTAAAYAAFLEQKDILAIIDRIIGIARAAGDLDKEDEWLDVKRKCVHFLAAAKAGGWVSLFKTLEGRGLPWHTVELKPVYVRDMAQGYVFALADKVLIMSATLLSAKVVMSSLGISASDAFAMRFGNRFPIKNRPIFVTPVGSLSFKHKMQTLPRVAPAVDKILACHAGHRGIIHTHNFEIARLLLNECKSRGRMLFQEDFVSKEAMLEEHARRRDSILVAPALHMGVDLRDDLSRVQIIVKMPYPPIKGNPQLEARLADSEEYYDLLVALKLVQSAGRSVRSETDWAHTYILDSDFGWFVRKAGRILPQWFKDAIVWNYEPKPANAGKTGKSLRPSGL